MPIVVKLFSSFREATGVDQINVANAKDVRSLLNILAEKFGPKFTDQLFEQRTSRLRSSVVILVNGHSIRIGQGLDTPLNSSDVVTTDTVAIFETVGGG